MWLKCQEKQHGCFVCVYRFSTTSTNVSTDSANEGKKCLVKSGKVRYVGASFFNCSLNGILVISNHAENAESIERSYVKTTYTLNSYDSQSAKYRSYEILGDTVPSLSPNGNVVINDYIK